MVLSETNSVLTVLFATRNGATTLPLVLEAYDRLEPPQGGWALVIVDNGSTDDSRMIIAGFQDTLPVTCVLEPHAGKNIALNAGLAYVAGDLVVLTDDDAVPRPDWLVRLREAADSHAGYGIFGGAVVAHWETDPPAWLLNSVPLSAMLTLSDPNLMDGDAEGHYIFGPNMAVRAQIFADGHRFDPSIGPSDSPSYAMGSETEFVHRVMGHGVRAWYTSTAVVAHRVRTTQMRRSWILRKAMRFGRGQCCLHRRFPLKVEMVWGLQPPPYTAPRCFGVPFPLIYQLTRKIGSVGLALLQFNSEKLFRSSLALSFVFGYAREARHSAEAVRQ